MILLFLTPGPPRGGRSFASYAGLKLSKNSAPPSFHPFFRGGENGCKITAFSFTCNYFRNFFSFIFKLFSSTLTISEIQTQKKADQS